MLLPKEFELAAACCRWPISEEAIADIRGLAKEAIDWSFFLRIVRRQHVVGLAHNVLAAAKIELPPPIARVLMAQAQRIAHRNLQLAAETARLQRTFDAANIPVMVLKGAPLAQLAYGSLTLKQSKDIDLLVPFERVQQALALLERESYASFRLPSNLNKNQFSSLMQYGVEVSLHNRDRNVEVELRWRLTPNQHLLTVGDAWPNTQDIVVSGTSALRTLEDDILFAYLCTHGAGHGWSRLQWLADLNALIAHKSDAELERLYRFAQADGSGFCAGQALLLCERLLHTKLPAWLKDELQSSRRLKLLTAMALDVMTGPDFETALENRPFGSTRVTLMQFVLSNKWAYLAVQCRIVSVRLGDTIQYPLPSSLHFLYPILRLPLWIFRRTGGRRRVATSPARS
jgi:Uncharacterised nucleotidyltransferase